MINTFKKFFKYIFLIVVIAGSFQAFASSTNGTIDASNHSALLCMDDTCATTTSINFRTTNGREVHVTNSVLTGDVWSEEMGWINLDPTNGGVENDGDGNLSGYAWGENAGWINFAPANGGVSITSTGKFLGWAWAQNFGWIRFNCSVSGACVKTDWGTGGGSTGGSTGGGGGGEGGGDGFDICPNIDGDQSLIPSGLVINSVGDCVTPEQCNEIDESLKQPLDVMIIIDRSGSMAGTKLIQAKNAATSFIDNLVPGSDRVGYVSYSTSASLITGLSTSFSTTKTKIQATTASGNTNIGGAVKSAYQEIYNNGRDGVKHVVILLTDGEANISDVSTLTPNQYAISRSNIAKLDGTIIYSIGLGTSVDSNLLKSVATLPSYFYHSPTGEDLTNIYMEIAAIECTAAPSDVFDMVVHDTNANAIKDGNEGGLIGSQVSIVSMNNSQPVRSLTTPSSGKFLFDHVAPGAYSVCNASPSGMHQTYPLSDGCYNINVIQGIDITNIPFLVSGTIPFCALHPTDPSCIEPDFCILNPTDPSCAEPDLCTLHPDDPSCTIEKTFCELYPSDLTCQDPDFCTIYPSDPTCTETTLCVLHPNDPACTGEDFCTIHPSDPSCIGDTFCDLHPSDPSCSGGGNGDDNCVGPNCSGGGNGGGNGGGGITILGDLTWGDLINDILDGADFIKNIFRDSVGAAIAKTVATVGAATGLYFGVVNVAFSGPLSLSEILLTPIRLWHLLLLAFGLKKRRSPWGTVYDSVTKQPLDPAYVVLQDLNGNEVATSITDLDGRYGFLVPKGQYRLVANKTNYEFPSKKLAGKTKDELYEELYFNEIIEVKEDGEVITKNIPLDPIRFDWNEFAKKDKKLMKFFSRRQIWIARISDILFILGFIVAIISTIVSPISYNIAILTLYVLMYLLRKTILKPRAFGNIHEKTTEYPLPFAVLRVFFPGSDHEVIHKVADKTGRYYCLVPNGIYYTKIESKNPDESYSLVHTSEPIDVKRGYINKKFKV